MPKIFFIHPPTDNGMIKDEVFQITQTTAMPPSLPAAAGQQSHSYRNQQSLPQRKHLFISQSEYTPTHFSCAVYSVMRSLLEYRDFLLRGKPNNHLFHCGDECMYPDASLRFNCSKHFAEKSHSASLSKALLVCLPLKPSPRRSHHFTGWRTQAPTSPLSPH